LDHLCRTGQSPVRINSVVISSVFQIFKIFNASENGWTLRCYPKCDGCYTYDPSDKMTELQVEDFMEEIRSKLEVAEKMFNRISAFDYAFLKGTILSRFMSTYIQTKDWTVSCCTEELCSRLPTPEEANVYQIENDTVSIFLPVRYEEGEEWLPGLLKKHIQELSRFVAEKIAGFVEESV